MTAARPTTVLLLQDDDCFRPASPKYDENNYFYHTPAVFKQAGPSSRHWATPGKFLAAAPSQRVVEVQLEAAAAAAAAANSGRGSQESSACKRTAADVSREPQGKGIACAVHYALRWTGDKGSRLHSTDRQPAASLHSPGIFAASAAGGPKAAFQDRPPPLPQPPAALGGQQQPTRPADARPAAAAKRRSFVSQITPPSPMPGAGGQTPVSQSGFKRLVPGKGQQLTLTSIEVHADSRCGPQAALLPWQAAVL